MKKKLIESFTLASIVKVQKEEVLKEGKVYLHWQTPVWQLGVLNLNGRVYTYELGKRVEKENKVTMAYDGHDDYNKNFGEMKAVCKDPFIKDNELWVNVYIIDEQYADILSKAYDLGLAIGVSSVGYGEIDKDGVVNPATYEVVRYLDFVPNPAGQVYAAPKDNKEDKDVEENSKKPTESTDDVEDSTELEKTIEFYAKINKYI